jgi:CRISPR-associated protein Csy1
MKDSPSGGVPRSRDIRLLIHSFIEERLKAKLDALKEDDLDGAEKLKASYSPATWLEDAARRAGQLSVVTHSIKPIHGDAKGTSVFATLAYLSPQDFVGTHCVAKNLPIDVVGNAAALDVFKLLQCRFADHSLLELAQQDDADFIAALSDDRNVGAKWAAAFADLTAPPSQVSSHTLAKQLYWPTGADSHDNSAFHLLAPLYPTSLVQKFYTRVQADRFGDDAKAAKAARREGAFSSTPIHDYPQLAMIKLGGTKPQNISQLNSERGGQGLLLASLPPTWRSSEYAPLFNTPSLFKEFGRRRKVREFTGTLKRFLQSKPRPILETREFVRDRVQRIVEEFIAFTGHMRDLESGWTQDTRCQLGDVEKLWLDGNAHASEMEKQGGTLPRDVPQQICDAFANWLNARLESKDLPFGDDQAFEWMRTLRREIDSELKAELEELSDADTESVL